MPFYHSLRDGAAWLWLLALLGVIAGIAWSFRRARLLSFGLSAFMVLLLPMSSVVPIRDALAERRMYLPIIGLILACLWALDQLRPREPTLRVAAAGILLILAGLAFARSEVWGNDISFWRDSVNRNTANSRAHLGLGNAYLAHGRCAEAIAEYETIQRQDRVTDESTTNLAAAYQCNRQPELALQALQSVVRNHPTAGIFTQIGYIEGTLGHPGAAITALNEAIARDPANAAAYAYRGIERIALGEPVSAASADIQKSLEIEPGNKIAVSAMTMLMKPR